MATKSTMGHMITGIIRAVIARHDRKKVIEKDGRTSDAQVGANNSFKPRPLRGSA